MYHVIFLSLKLMFERKRQTFVSIIGVSIGVAAFIVMASLMNGFQKYFIEQAIDLNAHITLKVKPDNNPQEIVKLFLVEILSQKFTDTNQKKKKTK